MSEVKSVGHLKPFLTPRIIRLLEVLQFFCPKNIEKMQSDFFFSGIIFVEQRYVAYVINVGLIFFSFFISIYFIFLKGFDEIFKFIHANNYKRHWLILSISTIISLNIHFPDSN